MQKAFIAIALALTLTSVATLTTPDGTWVKTITPVVQNTDWNFTDSKQITTLSPFSSTTDLNLISYSNNITCDKKGDTPDLAQCSYSLNVKPIATKDLSSSKNNSYGFKAGSGSGFANGIAFALLGTEDNNKVNNLMVVQTKVEGNSPLPQVIITTNKDASVTPALLESVGSGKTMMYFIGYNTTTNFTSYTLGGSTAGKQFNWKDMNATKLIEGGLTAAWGEALSSTQAFVGYKDDKSYKVGVVDFGSGTIIGAATLTGYHEKMDCQPYVTDKKLYGVFCTNVTSDDKGNQNTTLFASTSNNTLFTLYTVVNSTGVSVKSFPYSAHLGLLTTNGKQSNATTLSKEAWDLTANKGFINKTAFVTYDTAKEVVSPYRIPGAGYYALVYTQNTTESISNRTDVKVGQFMAGSSLTTVFGFLMTIVAGLFLF